MSGDATLPRALGESGVDDVGEPGGAQAVGAACGRNPVPVIVPCHRVVGADGKLVGFGGGLPRKRHLLQLEDIVLKIVHKAAPRRDTPLFVDTSCLMSIN